MIKRWMTSGAGAVADHGLMSLSNFLVNILLVRWMAPGTYGEFVLGWTVLLLIGAAHAGFVLEPMLVFGSSEYKSVARSYLVRVARVQFTLLLLLSALIATAGLFTLHIGNAGVPVIAGAAAAPFVLSFWTLRKATYVSLSPHVAAMYSGVYLVLSVAGLFVLERYEVLTPLTALLGVAGASALTCLAFMGRNRLSGLTASASPCPQVSELLRAHWTYGKWAAPSWMLSWTSQHIFYLLLPFSLGTASVGVLKASVTALAPAIQPVLALSSLLVAGLARVRGQPQYSGLMRGALLGALACGVLVWFALAKWHAPLLQLMYGPEFESPVGLFLILGGLPLFTGVSLFAICGLQAHERTKEIFLVMLGAATATLVVGVPLSGRIAVAGAAAGLLAGMAVRTVLALGVQARRVGSERPPAPSAATVGP